jgi:hypothetical protein
MRLSALPLCLLLAGTALSAHASYVTISYDGVVSRVMRPDEAPGIAVGDIVTYSATFDPSTAVDVGATIFNIDGDTGLPVDLSNLRTVSIADDPNASDRITIGSYVFTQADDPDFGQDFGLGAGNFPFVVYNGTQLLGIDIGAVASNGLYFYSDPIAALLHHAPTTGLGGLESSDSLSFLVTTDLDGAIAAAAVPEPSTWAMTGLALALFAALTQMPGVFRRLIGVGAAASGDARSPRQRRGGRALGA